jgi:RNA polymerase sigma-70 factor, ECF subfamily
MAMQQDSVAKELDDGVVLRARTDREALGQLYDAYYPRVFRYCFRRLFVRAVAEDVTSEVFLHVASNIGQFQGASEEDFCRWVFRIATNEVNAWLRQTKRRRLLWETAAQDGQGAADVGSSSGSTNIEMLDWPLVYRAIACLKPRDQAILVLRFFEQMSHKEIAEVLCEHPDTIRTALNRTLQALRKQLQSMF